MSLIYQEQNERSLGWKLACKGALLQLIAYLVRRYAEQMLTDKESLKRRKNLERLNTVVHYIEENYTDSISNAQLAELIHVSEDRFNHLFRESMGMAPLQYMNEVRLKKAMHLLKSGIILRQRLRMRSDFRITIISEDCSGGIINVHRWKRCGNPRARVQSVRVEVQESKPSKSDP